MEESENKRDLNFTERVEGNEEVLQYNEKARANHVTAVTLTEAEEKTKDDLDIESVVNKEENRR